MIRTLTVILATMLLIATGAARTSAHDAPGSESFDLIIPPGPYNGQITWATLIGPDVGREVLHATWNVTFVSPPGGTLASDVELELEMPLETGSVFWLIHGSDLGFPAAHGTFSGSLDSELLNGVLAAGGFPFSTPELFIATSVGGNGLTGSFIDSTITLELAVDGVCQQDLGFGDGGPMQLQICGDPLTATGEASLTVEGAPPSGFVFFFASTSSNPTPFGGGSLVPIPILLLFPVQADGTGDIAFTVRGGNGPLTVFLQCAAELPGQPFVYSLSNALQVELLP